MLTIDATDAGSEEMSPKNRTSPLRLPSAIATEIFSFEVSQADENYAIFFHGSPSLSMEQGSGLSRATPDLA
ncbi:hypothetical protein CN063_20030 [Sinorhizobium meliloti]|nr:hypothetical protein CN088_29680 [Sinorhizobium meliloti]RVQ11696.1 hypothetical protein CN063_20030 [Sinorhizobium meliloti]